MSRLSRITVAVMAAGVVRQAFVLSGIVRSGQFLRQGKDARPRSASSWAAPRFFIVVPLLREAAILPETVAHFQALACGHAATVVLVTTAREAAEAPRHAAVGDTIAAARELAREGKCVHLHYPDPLGLKADQLNHAAAYCAALPPTAFRPRRHSWPAMTRTPARRWTRWTASPAQSPTIPGRTSSTSHPASSPAPVSARPPGRWAGPARRSAMPGRCAPTGSSSASSFPGSSTAPARSAP